MSNRLNFDWYQPRSRPAIRSFPSQVRSDCKVGVTIPVPKEKTIIHAMDAHRVTYERLQASEALLPLLEEPHEEFDRTAWLQYAGICALHLHDYPLAIQQLQLALEQLPSSWQLRTIATAVPLIQALAYDREMERALEVIQRTTPFLLSAQAPTLTQPFVTYLEQEVLPHLPENEQSQRLAREAQQQLAIPRRGH